MVGTTDFKYMTDNGSIGLHHTKHLDCTSFRPLPQWHTPQISGTNNTFTTPRLCECSDVPIHELNAHLQIQTSRTAKYGRTSTCAQSQCPQGMCCQQHMHAIPTATSNHRRKKKHECITKPDSPTHSSTALFLLIQESFNHRRAII